MIYLANCIAIGVGSRLPIWKTAIGLAYMAELLPPERLELLTRCW